MVLSLKVTNKEKDITSNNINNNINSNIDYKNVICIKPWGYEFLAFETNKIGIWILSINKQQSTSLHCHFNKDTTIIILEGCAKLTLIDDVILLPVSTIINIPKNKFHSLSSISNKCMIMEIEIFTENVSFSDKNDLLRIGDQYTRDKTGYEKSVTLSYDLDKYQYFYFNKDFQNKFFKIIKIENNLQSFVMNSCAKYLLLEGVINNSGTYIKEGSIITEYQNNFLNDYLLILEINIPFCNEDAKIIYDLEHLELVTSKFKDEKIILTSGCFDIIHIGHMHNLKESKLLGDKLFVCLSNDKQIKALKGEKRPINNYNDRINLFKTISYVDYIILYDENDIANETTLDTIIKIVNPFYWVKGSDYNVEEILKKHPTANVKLIDNIKHISTTTIISNIAS